MDFNGSNREYENIIDISVDKATFTAWRNPSNKFTVRQQIEDELFQQYGFEYSIQGKSFVIIRLEVFNQGIIRVQKCLLQEMIWKFKEDSYILSLRNEKKELIFERNQDLTIIIDEADNYKNTVEKNDNNFFEKIAEHLTYQHHKLWGCDKSELKLKLAFFDVEGRKTEYSIIARFNTGDTKNLITENNVITCITKIYSKMEKKDEMEK